MRAILSVLVAVLIAVFPAVALAQTASFVEHGPVMLDDSGRASFTLKNTGNAPLHVTSIYPRTTEKDPRLPPGVSVALEGGGVKAELAPGATRRIDVRWDGKLARAAQLVGHVVVESNDPASPQIAMGVRGERGPRSMAPLRHLLSTAAIVPMLGGLAIALLAIGKRADAAVVRWVALIATAIPCAIAVRVVRVFDGALSRVDGNDGFQMIERVHLAGPIEFWLGVDGLSMPFVVLSAGVAFAAVLASGRVERRSEAHLAALLVLSGASTLAFAAIDSALFFAAISLAACSLVALVAFAGGSRRIGASIKVAVPMVTALALLAVVIVALHHQTPPGFLIDGTRATSFGWAEIARVDLLERSLGGARLFGHSVLKVSLALSFVAFAIFAALTPFHSWLGDAVEEAPGAGAAFVAAIFTKLGIYGIARLDVSVLSDAFRWAAPVLSALGVLAIAWGAVSAAGDRDLGRIVARLATAHAGLALLGLSSTTAQGIEGAILVSSAHALSAALVVLVLAYVAHRLETRDASRFSGLGSEAPHAAIALGVGVAASAAMPGLLAFAGALFSVLGVLPMWRSSALAGALAIGFLGVVVARAFSPMLFGRFDAGWRSSAVLEPHGGRLPDLDARALVAVVPLALLLVLLGLSPAPLTNALDGAIQDLDARLGSGVR
ncbi:MAG: proton-conducting transporter transmembrane domain-containing protein [Polyangiales bacterium]